MLKDVSQFMNTWLGLHGLSFGRSKRVLRNKGFVLEARDGDSWWYRGKAGKSARIFKSTTRKGYVVHYEV